MTKYVISLFLLFSLLLILTASGLASPYPKSANILEIAFEASTKKHYAPGSDNWAITWADNDHQYATFGDGGGFGGTNTRGRVSLGIARIEGPWDDYSGYNVWGGNQAENPVQFSGKSYGIISIRGVLYMWRSGETSGSSVYEFQELFRSNNHASIWESTGVKFHASEFPADKGFFCPTFLQFGKDYDQARDNYVYIYAPETKTSEWDVNKPGEISFIRVSKDSLEDRKRYEYFSGLDFGGNPIWTHNIYERKPVFEDRENGVLRTSVNYNSGLKRYFLITQHKSRFRSKDGHMGIYEAKEPWGPWHTVLFENAWNTGLMSSKAQKTVYWNFSNKWLSNDGREFTLVYTDNDEWATIRGRFKVSEDLPSVLR